MPIATIKPLYLASTVGELNKRADEIPKNANPKLLVKSCEKVYKRAEELNTQCDEEQAYVFYMKYFNLVSAIKKTADYKKNSKFYSELIGTKKSMKAIEEAERLSNSLKNRYEEREAEEVIKKLDKLDVEKEKRDKEKADKEESKEAEKRVDSEEPKTNGTNENSGYDGSITVQKLYTLFNDPNTTLLLCDTRPDMQYAESHIRDSSCINVPQDIIPPGITLTYIEKALPAESKEKFSQRGMVDHIVLLDWRSSVKELLPGTTLRTLKDALYKFDSSVIIKSEPLVLEGGYEEFLLYYPTLTTNAQVSKPFHYQMLDAAAPSLDTIEYDVDLDFLKPKVDPVLPSVPPQVRSTNHLPTVDRKLKPNLGSKVVSADSNSENVGRVTPKTSNDAMMTETAPKRELNSEAISKPRTPVVPNVPDRKSKPASSFSASNARSESSSNGLQGEAAEAASELKQLQRLMKKKQEEYERFQEEKERMIAEHRARQARLESDQKALDNIQDLKNKQLKETADIMRHKRKIEDELRQLEKDKEAQDTEESKKKDELAQIRKDEEAKARRMAEIQKLRDERKKTETNYVPQGEIGDKKEEADIAQKQEDAERQRKEKDEKFRLEQERAEQLRKKQVAELEAKRKADEQARSRAEREARAHAEAEAKVNADAKAKVDAEVKAKAEAEAKARNRAQWISGEYSTPGMPVGWEKRLDKTTGTYKFIDHNTANVYSQPPQNIIGSPVKQEIHKTKLKDEGSSSGGGGLRRSHSSPNIAKLVDESSPYSGDLRASPSTPSVDRVNKPKPVRQEVQPPTVRTEVAAAKVRNLQPTYGSVNRGLTGLRNMGNTCYMNSTLQCLSNTAMLIHYFTQDLYRQDINRENFLGSGGYIAEEYGVLSKALWSGHYRHITPRDFKYAISKTNPMFSGYDQQDSQELLLTLMDCLHEDLNKVRKRPKIPEQNNERFSDNQAADQAWRHHKLINDSIIVDVFQGLFKSTVTCSYCEKKSVTFDAFMYLSLPIPSSTRCTLRDCLLHFSKEEKMTGESRWRCPNCKCKRDAVKKMVIWKLPPILLIHLKRFYYQGMWREKISALVDFPLDGLDLRNYIAGPSQPGRSAYSLYAVSNHYGTMEGGHYTAYCKSPANQHWFKFDDHEVYEISKSDTRSSAAYILFYTSIPNDLKFCQ